MDSSTIELLTVHKLYTSSRNDLSRKEASMLVLSRRKNERVMLGEFATITVVEVRGDKVRLGIDAPRGLAVHREEVFDAIKRQKGEAEEHD